MKKILSFILTLALIAGFIPSVVPTTVSAATGDEFKVDICETTDAYLKTTSAGSNWIIDAENSSEDLVSGNSSTAVRIQKGSATDPFSFATIKSGHSKGLCLKFSVENSGWYNVISVATPYKLGGSNIEVYVDGTLVGSFDSFGSEANWPEQFRKTREEELGCIYLTAGEYAHTLTIKGVDNNAYMQGVKFTKGNPKPVEVKFDFLASLDRKPSNADNPKFTPAETTGKNFVTVADESCSVYQGDNRVYTIQGRDVLQFDVDRKWSSWIASENNKETKWTFKLPISVAGWYNVKFQGALWFANASYYVYVNDKYAGYYNFCNKTQENPKAAWEIGPDKVLNTLYLEPDSDGYVKISLNYAKQFGYGQARMQPIQLTLSPTADQTEVKCVDIIHTIPEKLAFDANADFTAYAVMSDGTTRHFNGYKADATADNGNFIDVKAESDNVGIARFSDPLFDEGVYSGKISGKASGTTTVTLTAMIDGKPYTKNVTVEVLDPTEAIEMVIDLSGTGLVYKDSTKPSNDWKGTGYDIVLDKCFGENTGRRYENYGFAIINQLQMGASYSVWESSDNPKDHMFTIKKSIPVAGYYDLFMKGCKWKAGSDFAIYVNGKYVGNYNCYDAGMDTITEGNFEQLDSMYLPKGDVEISFRTSKAHYSTANLLPLAFKITPSNLTEIKISDVSENIPETMQAGEVSGCKTQVTMNNGNLKPFGYTDDRKIPTTDNVVKVKSSNPAVVYVSDVVCVEKASTKSSAISQIIDHKTTTYSLRAIRSGTADITVTAIVNGEEKSVTKTVTVSGNATEETITKTGASVSILALDGGSVETSLDDVVDNVPFGTKVTAEATANDGYVFAYWQDSNGAVLSENAKETFVINTNTSIKAYFEKLVAESETTVPVYFYNGNGSLLERKTVEKNTTFVDAKIDEPSLTGYVFSGWSIADETVIDNILRAVALYNDSPATYTVTVIDGERTQTISGKTYGSEVEVTASGNNFSYWVLGDDIVSYDKTFAMKVYGNKTLTAVYGENVEKAPTVALDKVGESCFLTYGVPEGYTLIEAGIVFSKTGTPGVGASHSKAIARTGSGQFTAMSMGEGDNIARGYVMYRDGSAIKVIYAE